MRTLDTIEQAPVARADPAGSAVIVSVEGTPWRSWSHPTRAPSPTPPTWRSARTAPSSCRSRRIRTTGARMRARAPRTPARAADCADVPLRDTDVPSRLSGLHRWLPAPPTGDPLPGRPPSCPPLSSSGGPPVPPPARSPRSSARGARGPPTPDRPHRSCCMTNPSLTPPELVAEPPAGDGPQLHAEPPGSPRPAAAAETLPRPDGAGVLLSRLLELGRLTPLQAVTVAADVLTGWAGEPAVLRPEHVRIGPDGRARPETARAGAEPPDERPAPDATAVLDALAEAAHRAAPHPG